MGTGENDGQTSERAQLDVNQTLVQRLGEPAGGRVIDQQISGGFFQTTKTDVT